MLSLPREGLRNLPCSAQYEPQPGSRWAGSPRHSHPGPVGPHTPAAGPRKAAPYHSMIYGCDRSHPEPTGIRVDVSRGSKQPPLKCGHLRSGSTGLVRSPSVPRTNQPSHTRRTSRRQPDVPIRYFLVRARSSAISSTISSIVRTRTVLLCNEFRNFFP